jgi:CBS-domain-containing membrane protein
LLKTPCRKTSLQREIAALLVKHRISAVPVIATDGGIVGIVSQTDLGHRSETETEKRRKWWLDIFSDTDTLARKYTKSHGLRAEDVMSRHIISVNSSSSLSEVADVLDTHRIRQAPVFDGGRLVGMISRTDLVRKLAEVVVAAPAERPPNGQLQKEIWARIKSESWLSSSLVNVSVKDGNVELYGGVTSDAQRQALRALVESVPGVLRVENNVALLPKVVAA